MVRTSLNRVISPAKISQLYKLFVKGGEKNRTYSTHLKTEIIQIIEEHTEISRDHLTPEVTLRLITPNCSLWTADDRNLPFPDPFWAFYWPGGQVLTRYILDNPALFHGKCIVDIGSGCGASAIACKLSGARDVIANDIDKFAACAISINSKLNQVDVEISQENLIGNYRPQWNTVLLGDMFYDSNFADVISSWVPVLSDRGIDVLIGDPGRYSLENHPLKQQLVQVFKHQLPENCLKENNGMTKGFVWKYSPNGN